jgi:hypothetical protein
MSARLKEKCVLHTSSSLIIPLPGNGPTPNRFNNGLIFKEFRKRTAMTHQPSLLFFALMVLTCCYPVHSRNNGFPVQDPTSIVLIGWDGADRRVVQKLIARGKLPNLQALSKTGSFVDITVQGTTDTRAGWAEILTGCLPSVTGVYSNVRYNEVPCGYTIFERLKRHFGGNEITTAAFIGKEGYVLTGPHPLYAIDEIKDGLVQDSVVAGHAVSFLARHSKERFFLFVHFDGPDRKGHGFGEFSREYRQAIREADRQTGIIMKQLRDLGLLQNTTVYVTADHGFDKNKITHHNAPDVFLASSDPAITSSGSLSDITPTMLHRLGVHMNETTPQVNGIALSKAKKFRFKWPKLQSNWLAALYGFVYPTIKSGV